MAIKEIFRMTYSYISRCLKSAGFLLSVCLGVVILLTTVVYKDIDGASYNLLTVGFYFEKEELISNHLNVQKLFSLAINYAMPMYGTLLAAISYAGTFCEEQKSGAKRYLLFRAGKVEYVLSKSFAAIFISGVSFVVAGILLLVFLYWKYPLVSAQDMDSFQSWMEFYSQNSDGSQNILYKYFGEHAFCIQHLSGLFVYGVFCGFIGYTCAAFFSNVYLLVCVPFFLGYIYYSIVRTINARAIEGSISFELVNALNSYVSPTGYMNYWRQTETLAINMLVLLVAWCVAIGIHILRVKKVSDCGGM